MTTELIVEIAIALAICLFICLLRLGRLSSKSK